MNKTALNSQKEKHSMLSLRRATFVGLAAHRLRNISIHALLAESDADNGDAGNGCDAISIHALLAESDYWLPVRHSRTEAFLSTLSLRRATAAEHRLLALNSISIHALLAESDLIHITQYSMCKISIHALLAESDAWCMSRKTPVQAAFLSTLSLRRATLPETAAVVPSRQFLSTLSLRRATPRTKSTRSRRPYFYPRSPCGERQNRPVLPCMSIAFLSTLSLRRATCGLSAGFRVGGYFYPRSPCGERQDKLLRLVGQAGISIHALLAESDAAPLTAARSTTVFLSTLSLRRATCYSLRHSAQDRHFYPRSPCGERQASPKT